MPFPVKSSTLSSTANTIGLSAALLNVPAPPIARVCKHLLSGSHRNSVSVVPAAGMETVALSATLIAPETVEVCSCLQCAFQVKGTVQSSGADQAESFVCCNFC